jgi:CheY-like chemotaxis protein
MLLDLNVPKRNGEEVLRAIRGDDRLKDLPVVVVSSSDSPRDRNIAASLGVSQYITKPLRLSEYLEIGNRVKALLAARPRGARALACEGL